MANTSTHSGAGFCAVRFFIGLTEAPFFPGLTLCKCNAPSKMNQEF